MGTRVTTIYVLSKIRKMSFFSAGNFHFYSYNFEIAWACFRNETENLNSNQTVLKSAVSMCMLRYHMARITKNSDC